MRRLPLLLALLIPSPARAEDLLPKLRAALVRVDVAAQSWDTNSPWQKRPVEERTGQGVVIEPGTVLTLARLVQDAQLVEVSVANSARRYPARVKHMDLPVGLALVEITDPELRKALVPLPVGEPLRLDDEFDLYQLADDNMLQRYTGRVVSASSQGPRLQLRLNTTLPGSGDGQSAVKGGKLIGLILGIGRGQEGTLLSVETIRRYLADFEDGVYQGPPGPGLFVQQLLRDDLRAYYGLSEDQHGIAITRIMPGRTGDGVLQENDVLLAVDGYDLDDEGKFTHEVHGRLDASYLFQGRRNAGEKVRARIVREGKVQEVEFELRPQAAAEAIVSERPPGRPEFLMVGGLVILKLTKETTMGRRSAGGVVLRRYTERAGWDPAGDRKQVVFVSHVLSDVANKGFEDLFQIVLESVNGVRIREIADVAKALDAPQEGYHVFHFEGVESDFVIPAGKLDEINQRIAKNYRVSRLRDLGGEAGGEGGRGGMHAFDIASSGRIAAIGRDPRRLSLGEGVVEIDFEALRCRFRGEDLVVLGRKSELLSLAADGKARGAVRVREGALDVAVLKGGSIVVSYGRRGSQRHGVTVERIGDAPCVFKDPELLDATCLAPESGGVWVLGTAAAPPTCRAVRLRPTTQGFSVREVVPLMAPPRSATVGPDGALFVLLEPGESLVRIEGGVAGAPVRLNAPLQALARQGRKLLGCGAKGVEDLSRLVAKPLRDAAPPPLPPCAP